MLCGLDERLGESFPRREPLGELAQNFAVRRNARLERKEGRRMLEGSVVVFQRSPLQREKLLMASRFFFSVR